MNQFANQYSQLNAAQREAVDTVYGPVLVIAGPGTGKTQLLSARVAHILEVTDALPQNILCLTFTESGAKNMRERLVSFIGQAAYDVQIGTYHAFGSTIIGRFPEYFTELRLERPVDELGKRQILMDIIENTDYRSPIKQTRHHLGDLVSTISEVKRGLLSPKDLRSVATDNIGAIKQTKQDIAALLAPFSSRMPSKLAVAEPLFESLCQIVQAPTSHNTTLQGRSLHTLGVLASSELTDALELARDEESTKPLTAWKNKWLVKDAENNFMLAGLLEARRIEALADVLEQYQAKLAEKGLYDFDDMILRAIYVLAENDELRFTLHEQYQFLLLDEFQDTNAAQLKLVELLTNNPSQERKPNVLAVGDDDQAIYAFQGAEASNMLDFYHMYKDVQVISLSDNYRSQTEILETAARVAGQIESRLHSQFQGVTKTLRSQNMNVPSPMITRRSYRSAVAERTAVAEQIAGLVASGTPAAQIAVLAPKHKYLEPLVPYLQNRDLAVSYEKRENVLQAPVIRELLTMSRLVLALHANDHRTADSLWPEVLSYDFWDFSTADIWQLSWRASDERKTWSELLLASREFKHATLLLLTLAGKVETESLEYALDALIGTSDIQTHDRELPSVRSPLRDYYFKQRGENVLYETVTQLTVLRSRLREHETGEGRVLSLGDLLGFVAAYETAEQPMLNTSPYSQANDAVQLMTVFKAKGLEFDHVFLVACDDSVWGSRASGVGNKLTLPANLAHIRHAGSTDDERLRLLYVAITRARYGLHLTSHEQTFAGRSTEAVKYFDESSDEQDARRTRILPEAQQLVEKDDSEHPSLEALTMNWQQRHYNAQAPLTELLRERLERYQLSPTHLTHFLDLKYGGPESFLLGTILRFPSAPSTDASFGTAIHETLQWAQGILNGTGKLPTAAASSAHAAQYLARETLTPEQLTVQTERAAHTLRSFFAAHGKDFAAGNVAEKSFRDEGVFSGEVHLGGKIDLLEIDKTAKKIVVVDYKTGQLGGDPSKLYRYTLQLYCYKLLVEGSRTYRGYSVEAGRLVFVEPDSDGKIITKQIRFEQKETQRVQELLLAMWQHVMKLNMPDTSSYGDSLKDIRSFEEKLSEGLKTQ
ncbi:MAG: ATP-dependent DNA helicase [Candidatus Saccharimonadales bacterium]